MIERLSLANGRGPRNEWMVRRTFDCEEGPVARWWGGWSDFGEPEDGVVFRTRIDAEESYRRYFGSLRGARAQKREEAFAEVREAYASDAVAAATEPPT